MHDADIQRAVRTLQDASTGVYDVGVSAMKPATRGHLCTIFAEMVVERLARKEQLKQIDLLVVKGVQQRRLPGCVRSGVFKFDTQVEKPGKGAGGRPVVEAQVFKKGPVHQRITSVDSGPTLPRHMVELDVSWNQFYAYQKAPSENTVRHRISEGQQLQAGSSMHIRISSRLTHQNQETFSPNCNIWVEIRNVHEHLDGVRLITFPRPQQAYVVIKKSHDNALTEPQLEQIQYRLRQPSTDLATISCVCQVKQGIVLHWLTLASFPKAKTPASHEVTIAQPQLEQTLQQALDEYKLQQQHQVLPSRVLREPCSGQQPDAATSSSTSQSNGQSMSDWGHLGILGISNSLAEVQLTISQHGLTLQQHGERLEISDAHLSDIDGDIDVIANRVKSMSTSAALHSTSAKQPTSSAQSSSAPSGLPRVPSFLTQHSPAPFVSQAMPVAAAPESTTIQQVRDLADPDHPLVQLLAGSKPPPAPYRAMGDHSDSDNYWMSDSEFMPLAPKLPAAEPLQHPTPSEVRIWDPFHSSSDRDLQDAILQVLSDLVLSECSGLSAMDIANRIWPESQPDDRSDMKRKVNRKLYALIGTGQLQCQAKLRPPQWSLAPKVAVHSCH